MGLPDLPHAKWSAPGRQIILKDDFLEIEQALLDPMSRASMPPLVWIDAATIRVYATADSPAELGFTGFPNILNPFTWISGGLSDGRYRINTAATSCNFGIGGALWGQEKASQWYAIMAIAGIGDSTFTLKAMPYLRVKDEAGQVISLGTNVTPATGLGYGFTTDQFADGSKIYVLTGASRGLVRTILHNNNDSGTAGSIEYSGSAISLSQGDWFIILPATNFRRLGDACNDASSNLTGGIRDIISGRRLFLPVGSYPYVVPFAQDHLIASMCAGGDWPTSVGQTIIRFLRSVVPGTVYTVIAGAANSASSIGSLISAAPGQVDDFSIGLVQSTYATFYGWGGAFAPGCVTIEY